jgi:hypothetical protein
MRVRSVLLSLSVIGLLTGLTACNASVLDPDGAARAGGMTRPLGGDPGATAGDTVHGRAVSVHTRGTITSVPSRVGTAAFLIEERPDQPLGAGAGPFTTGDKYHVSVDGATVIQRRTVAGDVRTAALAEIAEGMQAEVWFAGPIRESYPAQGTAARILILDPAP